MVALTVRNPLLAIPLSFASHFACDALPHFGVSDDKVFKRTFNIILVTDFLVSVAAMVVLGSLFPAQRWLIWACMVAAASPDLMWAYYRLYLEHYKRIKNVQLGPIARFHARIQWSSTVPGLAVEAGWAALMITVIANSPLL